MSELAITSLLIISLFLILGSGVWIGLTLSGVAWIGMQLFSSRAAGDARDRFAAGLFGGPRFHVFVEHGDLDRIEPSLGDAGALRRCGRRPSATLKTVLVRLYAAGPGRGRAFCKRHSRIG